MGNKAESFEFGWCEFCFMASLAAFDVVVVDGARNIAVNLVKTAVRVQVMVEARSWIGGKDSVNDIRRWARDGW